MYTNPFNRKHSTIRQMLDKLLLDPTKKSIRRSESVSSSGSGSSKGSSSSLSRCTHGHRGVLQWGRKWRNREQWNRWNAIALLLFLSVFSSILFASILAGQRIDSGKSNGVPYSLSHWERKRILDRIIGISYAAVSECAVARIKDDAVVATPRRQKRRRRVSNRRGKLHRDLEELSRKPYIPARPRAVLLRRRGNRSRQFARIDDQRMSYESRLLECTTSQMRYKRRCSLL